MCSHTTIFVFSYYYICVVILLYLCPHTAGASGAQPPTDADMLTYAHVCSRMLTYAHVCSRMLILQAPQVGSGPRPLPPQPRRPRPLLQRSRRWLTCLRYAKCCNRPLLQAFFDVFYVSFAIQRCSVRRSSYTAYAACTSILRAHTLAP